MPLLSTAHPAMALTLTTPSPSHYIGRFAPSPSGPLHFGSLITALASFLDAKHYGGQWKMRMEDLDPPREEAGAQQRIIDSLIAHGLHWDGEIMYQSQRLNAYENMLIKLQDHTYVCHCGRQRLLTLKGIYDSHCFHQPSPSISGPTSTRIRTDRLTDTSLAIAQRYEDIFQGVQQQSLQQEVGDFILRRKDGLFAYQLAVVADDIEQGITHIIRGSDLLSSTPRQRYLIKLFQQLGIGCILPSYGHIPVATNDLGQKLSKQHKAPALDDSRAFDNLCEALTFINHTAPQNIINSHSISQLLQWAITHWQREHIPNALSFVVKA